MAENRPIWNFEANRLDTLKFLFDNGKEIDTKIGKRWIWTVEHNGTEYTMFAPYRLNSDIEGLSIASGDVLYIKPLGSPRSKDCTYSVGMENPGSPSGPSKEKHTVKMTPEERVESYVRCLRMAMTIWHDERVQMGLKRLGLDQASPDTRLMALKDVATHLSMGMGREWAPALPEPSKPEPKPEPPPVVADDGLDLPF